MYASIESINPDFDQDIQEDFLCKHNFFEHDPAWEDYHNWQYMPHEYDPFWDDGMSSQEFTDEDEAMLIPSGEMKTEDEINAIDAWEMSFPLFEARDELDDAMVEDTYRALSGGKRLMRRENRVSMKRGWKRNQARAWYRCGSEKAYHQELNARYNFRHGGGNDLNSYTAQDTFAHWDAEDVCNGDDRLTFDCDKPEFRGIYNTWYYLGFEHYLDDDEWDGYYEREWYFLDEEYADADDDMTAEEAGHTQQFIHLDGVNFPLGMFRFPEDEGENFDPLYTDPERSYQGCVNSDDVEACDVPAMMRHFGAGPGGLGGYRDYGAPSKYGKGGCKEAQPFAGHGEQHI